MANITKNLGVVAPTVKGDWEATITYNELSIVSHKGATYIAKQQTIGVEPNVAIGWANYWQLLVKSCECAVVQETGTSKTETMSQKAVTDELNKVNIAIINETTARETADATLQANIDKKYDSENLTAGDGITFTSDGKKTTIASNNSNLVNGTGNNLYQKTCEAIGYDNSFATGYKTVAANYQAHAEGYETKALGPQSHAEGNNTKTKGFYSHSEGLNTLAEGDCSHAEGNNTQANAWASHSEGNTTIAGYQYQLVIGEYNNNKSSTRFEVGNGTSDTDRKNAFEVLSDGRAKVQSAPTEDDDVVRLKELTEKYNALLARIEALENK